MVCYFSFKWFFFLVLGAFSAISNEKLKSTGKEIHANVEDWRILNSKYNTNSHEIQYSFIIPNDKTVYYQARFWGMERLWSQISVEDWEKTKQSKYISVIYEPNNPWNNKVFNQNSDSDNFTLIALGSLIIIGSLWFIIIVKRKGFEDQM